MFTAQSVRTLDHSGISRVLVGVGIVVAIGALLVPMLDAGPAPLTSDESLYLSEAYNIATGVGPKYTSQEIVNHRAPLFPALLAIPIKLTGDPDNAYLVSKLVVVALVAAVFLLGRELFDTLTGAIAALLVASSAFLRWMGTTLFLDGAETLFLLLFLFATARAFKAESLRWFAGAGALFGLAFLTKEAAIQLLPLPVVFALLSADHRNRRIVNGLAAYGAIASGVLAFWWGWVYVVTGRVYFWGAPDLALMALIGAVVLLAATAAVAWLAVLRWRRETTNTMPTVAGLAFLGCWVVGLFLFLEMTSWPFPHDHARNVPEYLWRIAAPNTQPWPLVGAAIVWLAWRARTGEAARLLVLVLALFLPFTLFVANRDFSYRDLLPAVYVAYIGAGALAAIAFQWGVRHLNVGPTVVLTLVGLGGLALIQSQHLVHERLPYADEAVTERNWDNPMVHDLAAWIHENVPRGDSIVASRLYFSHLYVLDEGAHPIYQLPVVRVEPTAGEPRSLRPVTTLFRWEDHRLQQTPNDEPWMYVRRYPIKQYYLALSEADLLQELSHRNVKWLLLTGEDAGFSSLAYVDYFIEHQAFELVYVERATPRDGALVFSVDQKRLQSRPYTAVTTADTLLALEETWPDASSDEVAKAIDPDGVRVRPVGLPEELRGVTGDDGRAGRRIRGIPDRQQEHGLVP